MRKKSGLKKFGFHGLRLSMAVILLLPVLVGGFLWRLHTSPMDVGFAKDYILNQMSDPGEDFHADMQNIALHWPEVGGPLYLWAGDVRVLDVNEKAIVSVDQVAVSLALAPLLAGQIAPTALIVKRPELSVTRDAQGDFDIGFGVLASGESAVEDTHQSFAEQIVEFVSGADHVLASVESLDIQEAQVHLRDEINDLSLTLEKTDFKFLKSEEGVRSLLSVSFPKEGVTTKTEVLIPWDAKEIVIKSDVQNVGFGFLASKIPELKDFEGNEGVLYGTLNARVDANLRPLAFDVEAYSTNGKIVIPDEYPDGVSYRNFIVAASFDHRKKLAFIKNAGVVLNDIPVKMNADLAVSDGEILGPVKVSIDAVDHAQIAPLWPKSLVEDNSYEWVVERITGAKFSDVFLSFDLRSKRAEDGALNIAPEKLMLGFTFENGKVDYRAPLMPVTEAKGVGVLDLNADRLDVEAQSGKLGEMTVGKTKVALTDIIAEGRGKVVVETSVEGPLSEVFRYVKAEPIGADLAFEPAQVKGHAAMDMTISLPTNDPQVEDIVIEAKGTATDAMLPNIVKGLAVAGQNFEVSIAKDSLLRVKGKGTLDSRAVDAEYQEYLLTANKPFKSKVSATLDVDADLRKYFGIDLSDFMSGTAGVTLNYTDYVDGTAQANVSANLARTVVFVKPFAYEKPAGVAGSATLQASLTNQQIKQISDLRVEAPGLLIGDADMGFDNGALRRGSIHSYKIMDSQGRIDFDIAPGGAQKIVVAGETLDVRPFLANEDTDKGGPYTDPPRQISVNVAKMITADGQAMQASKLYIAIDGQGRFDQFEMDGKVGAGDVYLRFKPDETGKRTFRLESGDAGAFLRAFGLYDKIRGGQLVVYGEPIKGVFDRNLKGMAKISDFRVVKAPGLAKLLSAMSLPGILQLLNNDGLVFTKLESNFHWDYRPRGSLLVLKDGRTSGNSVGFTFDGTIDQAVHTMDISGTVVPLSEINKALGSIPLIGDILSGGTGSIFAATFTMRGDSEDPEVSVNPLAVLTPGLIRRILFEN